MLWLAKERGVLKKRSEAHRLCGCRGHTTLHCIQELPHECSRRVPQRRTSVAADFIPVSDLTDALPCDARSEAQTSVIRIERRQTYHAASQSDRNDF